MLNLEIKLVRNIKCNFTAEQWQLFTASNPEECEMIAHDLNSHLTTLVNLQTNKDMIRKAMHVHMGMYRNYGAIDSEPMDFLDIVLDRIFATTDSWTGQTDRQAGSFDPSEEYNGKWI